MAFNPQAFLQKAEAITAPPKKTEGGFDPASFLAKAESITTPKPKYSALESGLHGAGDMASFGYLPHIQAGVTKLAGYLTGTELPSYVELRDKNIEDLAEMKRQNPGAYLAGNLVGGAAGLVAGGGLVGAGAKSLGLVSKAAPAALSGGQKVLQAAKAGGLYGAVSNPGDTKGEMGGLQLKDRAINAGTGFALGGGLQAGGMLAKAGVDKVRALPQALQSAGELQAYRATGGMLKDLRKANANVPLGKKLLHETAKEQGRTAIEKGIVQVGDSIDDIAEKSTAMRQEVGKKLGEIYKKATDAIKTPASFEKVKPRVREAIAASGFKPIQHADTLKSLLKQEFKGEVSGRAAFNRLSDYIDDLGRDYGDSITPDVVNQIKTKLQGEINFAKRSQDLPAFQKGLNIVQRFINKKNKQQISLVGRAVGDKSLKKELEATNKLFGQLSEISERSVDKASRETANRIFGLTDTIAGVGGAGAGAIAGGPAAAAVGLGAGLINKAGRQYGLPILSKGLLGAGKIASKLPPTGLGTASNVLGAATSRPGLVGAGSEMLLNPPRREGYKK